MKVTIKIAEDSNFRLIDVSGGLIAEIEPQWSPNVETITSKVEVVEPVVIQPPPQQEEYYPRPQGVPIENHRATDVGCWFGGTSWATK